MELFEYWDLKIKFVYKNQLDMYGEAKKLHLIEEIIKIENDAVLMEIESIVKQNVAGITKTKAKFSDLLGVLTDEEAESMKQTIEDNFEKINPDDWK